MKSLLLKNMATVITIIIVAGAILTLVFTKGQHITGY